MLKVGLKHGFTQTKSPFKIGLNVIFYSTFHTYTHSHSVCIILLCAAYVWSWNKGSWSSLTSSCIQCTALHSHDGWNGNTVKCSPTKGQQSRLLTHIQTDNTHFSFPLISCLDLCLAECLGIFFYDPYMPEDIRKTLSVCGFIHMLRCWCLAVMLSMFTISAWCVTMLTFDD